MDTFPCLRKILIVLAQNRRYSKLGALSHCPQPSVRGSARDDCFDSRARPSRACAMPRTRSSASATADDSYPREAVVCTASARRPLHRRSSSLAAIPPGGSRIGSATHVSTNSGRGSRRALGSRACSSGPTSGTLPATTAALLPPPGVHLGVRRRLPSFARPAGLTLVGAPIALLGASAAPCVPRFVRLWRPWPRCSRRSKSGARLSPNRPGAETRSRQFATPETSAG
jgi:hypothetical protein